MQIVTDSSMDWSPEQARDFKIHVIPQTFTLDGKTYRSGVDVSVEEFYQLIGSTDGFPITSQPSPGEFAEVYRKLAETDPDILSIHISSGLSGTYNAARLGAQMVPEANITLYDTKNLSGAEGWHVEGGSPRYRRGLEPGTHHQPAGADHRQHRHDVHAGDAQVPDSRRDASATSAACSARCWTSSQSSIVEKVGGTYVQKATVRSLKKSTLMLPELVAKQLARASTCACRSCTGITKPALA